MGAAGSCGSNPRPQAAHPGCCRRTTTRRWRPRAKSTLHMPFIPHTDDDEREMLATIGAPSIEALFDEIPANLRVQSLEGLPAGLSELEVMQLMAARARQDGRALCFIGAGAYEHHIPAAGGATIPPGGFYNPTTPYQAEASQG